MKIQGINCLRGLNTKPDCSSININRLSFPKHQLTADVVSFSAKKYDMDSILNPTNHCAYCGCKVYSDVQLDSIAKEMLSSKADRLQGKIKSVLEKLDGAKNSQEIALAKRIENEEQIKFFKNFLEISSKKSFLKGEAIFSQVYNLDKDEALETLTKNLRPLQRTIDHISPQNEEKSNNHSDVNLVEACYTCNHDLKKGSSFSEFYTMFPSIKNNMPPEKFQYALNQVLESSQSNVLRRLSASNMLKLIQRLFIQRTEAANYLDSIDYRIKNTKSDILNTIADCENEVEEKKDEKQKLEETYKTMIQDPVFAAMLKRINLLSDLDNQGNLISSLRERRQRASNAVNELRNPKSSKKKDDMPEEEKAQKIECYKKQIDSLSAQIQSAEEKELDIKIEIEDLDKEFPTVEVLQRQKGRLESLIEKINRLNTVNRSIPEKEEIIKNLTEQQRILRQKTEDLESVKTLSSDCSEEEVAQYESYLELVEALKFIEEHPNGGNIKVLINQSAKKQLEKQAQALEENPLVIQYKKDIEISALTKELNGIEKQKEDAQKQLEELLKEKSLLEPICSEMSKEEAEEQLEKICSSIRDLIDKSNYIKIPQRIATVNTEIILLKQTIQDLKKKLSEIESSYMSET